MSVPAEIITDADFAFGLSHVALFNAATAEVEAAFFLQHPAAVFLQIFSHSGGGT